MAARRVPLAGRSKMPPEILEPALEVGEFASQIAEHR
jgi:hypothetical protein